MKQIVLSRSLVRKILQVINVNHFFAVLLIAAHACHSVNDCKIAINCHPDKITYQPNQASCESRGCLWLSESQSATRPKCVYYNNSILSEEVNQMFVGGKNYESLHRAIK